MSPEPSVTRQTLEESWRLRLEEIQAHYHRAQKRYRRLLEEQPDGTPYDPNSAVALARQAETEAFAEYTRVLRAFTDLSVNGMIQEPTEASSDSV